MQQALLCVEIGRLVLLSLRSRRRSASQGEQVGYSPSLLCFDCPNSVHPLTRRHRPQCFVSAAATGLTRVQEVRRRFLLPPCSAITSLFSSDIAGRKVSGTAWLPGIEWCSEIFLKLNNDRFGNGQNISVKLFCERQEAATNILVRAHTRPPREGTKTRLRNGHCGALRERERERKRGYC